MFINFATFELITSSRSLLNLILSRDSIQLHCRIPCHSEGSASKLELAAPILHTKQGITVSKNVPWYKKKFTGRGYYWLGVDRHAAQADRGSGPDPGHQA